VAAVEGDALGDLEIFRLLSGPPGSWCGTRPLRSRSAGGELGLLAFDAGGCDWRADLRGGNCAGARFDGTGGVSGGVFRLDRVPLEDWTVTTTACCILTSSGTTCASGRRSAARLCSRKLREGIDPHFKPTAGTRNEFEAREIIDAGFLELVRYGVRRADDP